MSSKKRRLGDDERLLWAAVAKSARPLRKRHEDSWGENPDGDLRDQNAEKRNFPKPQPQDQPTKFSPFAIGEKSSRPGAQMVPMAVTRGVTDKMPVRMDAKAFMSMTRGKSRPEARLDLHGMTLSEAHAALIRFVLQSHEAGRRLVLVITGKGRAAEADMGHPSRQGVLRRQVPQWLSQKPLDMMVLQVVEAHRRHGGSGALYVYLRRPR